MNQLFCLTNNQQHRYAEIPMVIPFQGTKQANGHLKVHRGKEQKKNHPGIVYIISSRI